MHQSYSTYAAAITSDAQYRALLHELVGERELASAPIGVDAAWTKAQFSEWCRTSGLADLRKEEPVHASTRKFKLRTCCCPFCTVCKVDGWRKSFWLVCSILSICAIVTLFSCMIFVWGAGSSSIWIVFRFSGLVAPYFGVGCTVLRY